MIGTRSKWSARLAGLLVVGAGVCALATGCDQGNTDTPKAAAADPVKRGEYLVTIGHCNDCHTPWKMGPNGPEPDMTRMLSGHPASMALPAPPKAEGPWMWSGLSTMTAFAGPWGISYAPNLTPDLSGLGVWTEELFVKAMRTGKHMGSGRPIMPPMPWQNVAKMTDEDLAAVFAYLRSIPPIENAAPEYAPPTSQPQP
jgi:mono/diheme cytochrome c family protein